MTGATGAVLPVCVAVLLTGCIVEPDVGCDICTTSAVVHGTATAAAGEPVAGMPIDIRAYRESCDAEYSHGGTDNGLAWTDSAGRYRARPISLHGPFTARCIVVTANPNADSRWPTTADTMTTALRFLADYGSSQRDSVEVNITLTQ